MLEIRNVTKVYRSKTGEQVKALDNVSVTFPACGMVFILGKSGSGKSTLLNVIGGLDSYDEGEFIIKGKSSKDFVGSDFDAYRNTFIGFIFQEYNILDDFTVGANIGLALELQGIKATPEKINDILAQVDLVNYAHRKPNELSGGQKQRVAIARALVKQPQIIMADEPTGALDSNTGRAIFDALKELSREKLVLIVSHDRDFAERYADRIIELSDGRIISDVTKHEVEGQQLSAGVRRMGERILEIKGGYQLTAEDLAMINKYLADNDRGVLLSGDARVNSELRSAAGISESGTLNLFEETGAGDVQTEQYDGKTTKFIRSRLPMKNAVKMGSSGLKHKKFRLFLTILLSLVAFAMFGLADTMGAYDKITAATRSIKDSNVTHASFQLNVKETNYYNDGEKTRESSYYNTDNMNDEDIAWLRAETGLDFVPVFTGSMYGGGNVSLTGQMKSYSNDSFAYSGTLNGFVNMNAAALAEAGLTVTGRMPTADNEIAVSKFIYDQFNHYGFNNTERAETVNAGSLTLTADANGLLGKHIKLSSSAIRKSDGTDYEYVVVGVVDTQFDGQRYEKFLPSDDPAAQAGNATAAIADLLLQMELTDTLTYGFHTLGFVTSGAIADMAANANFSGRVQNVGSYTNSLRIVMERGADMGEYASFYRVASNEDMADVTITWLDGNARTTLGEKEYVIGKQTYRNILTRNVEVTRPVTGLTDKMDELFGNDWKGYPVDGYNLYDRFESAVYWHYVKENYTTHQAELEAEGIDSEQNYYDRIRWGGEDPLHGDFAALIEAAYESMFQAVAGYYGVTETAGVPRDAVHYLVDYLLSCATVEEAPLNWQHNTAINTLAQYYARVGVYDHDLLSNEAFVAAVRGEYYLSEEDWNNLTLEQKQYNAINYYCNYLQNSVCEANRFEPALSAAAVCERALTAAGLEVVPAIRTYTSTDNNGNERKTDRATYTDWTIVGVFDENQYDGSLIISQTLYDLNEAVSEEMGSGFSRTVRAKHTSGIWAFAVAPMPQNSADVEALVKISYTYDDLNFSLQNQVMNTLGNFNDFIETGAKVFLYVGLGFALFSGLLLMNFITISISYKKREIGILRAVGARSSDVFKIFFSESLIIALINYVLAIAATLIAIFFINRWMRGEGINVTLLNFGIRQLGLMLGVSVGVALISSFLPVWRIARKKPVDAIKDR